MRYILRETVLQPVDGPKPGENPILGLKVLGPSDKPGSERQLAVMLWMESPDGDTFEMTVRWDELYAALDLSR